MNQTTHDVNQPAPGYGYTPAQAQAARVKWIEQDLLPAIRGLFDDHPPLRSIMLAIAQYWNDNANDEVHALLTVSELDEPDLHNSWTWVDDDEPDPNVPTVTMNWPQRRPGAYSASRLYYGDHGWYGLADAISLWAAFAPEGGTQDCYLPRDNYAPAVTFYRVGNYEFHDMQRPWLDGIQTEWERNRDDQR